MKIKLKLLAVAVDLEGHEQDIEVELMINPANLSRTGNQIKGSFMLDDYGVVTGSFTFKEEHPFNTFPTRCQNE
jgi:hypothetical protein